jgi:hypothetical protein
MDHAATALVGETPTGVVDQPTSHFGRHQPKESIAIVDETRTMAQQPQVGLMEERRRLQGMAGPFAPQTSVSHPAQLAVRHRYQLLTGFGVSRSPRLQQFRNVVWHVSQNLLGRPVLPPGPTAPGSILPGNKPSCAQSSTVRLRSRQVHQQIRRFRVVENFN